MLSEVNIGYFILVLTFYLDTKVNEASVAKNKEFIISPSNGRSTQTL